MRLRLWTAAVALFCTFQVLHADPILTGITYTNVVITNRLNGKDDGGIRSNVPNDSLTDLSANGSTLTASSSGSTTQLSLNIQQTYKAPDSSLFDSVLVDFYTTTGALYTFDPTFIISSVTGIGTSLANTRYFEDLTTQTYLPSSGTLLIGHQYEAYEAGAITGSSGTATLTANATFLFSPTGTAAAPTPEPGSIVLLGTGVLGLANAVRRRRA